MSWSRGTPALRRAASVIVLVIASVVCGVAGQRPSGSRSDPEGERWQHLVSWLVAVGLHQPGTIAAPAVEIASWPDSRLNVVVADIGQLSRFLVQAHERFARTGQFSTYNYARRSLSMAEVQQLLGLTEDEARRGDAGRLVRRAVLLHTDIATALDRLDPVVRSRTASAQPSAVLISDGRHQGMSDRGPHWGVARSLFDLIPADSPHAGAKRAWYAATVAFMHSRTHMADLVPHLRKALLLFPKDAEILFYAGRMNETLAAPFIQEAVRSLSQSPGTKPDVASARTHLQDARTFFMRALESDPDYVEARVRLGRVLGLLGQHADAAGELQRAGAAPSPLLRYYAALFLGGEYVQLRKPDAARESFERAAALFPRAQAPRLGLSSLHRVAGNRAGAISVLSEALAFPHGDDSRDPWWAYFAASRDVADAALNNWRGSVAR